MKESDEQNIQIFNSPMMYTTMDRLDIMKMLEKQIKKENKTPINSYQLELIIKKALAEHENNIANWCTNICIEQNQKVRADIKSKQKTLVSGLEICREIFNIIDPDVLIEPHVENGEQVKKAEKIFSLYGKGKSLLNAQQLALNFLSISSSISYKTSQFVSQLKNTDIKLLENECHIPNLRIVSKSAALLGGAYSHRFFFKKAVNINQHHIKLNGSITNIINKLTESLPPAIKIEIEVSNLDQVQEAIDAGVHLIILQDMSLPMIKMAVRTIQRRALIEVSGKFTLEETRYLSQIGINFISNTIIFPGFVTLIRSFIWAAKFFTQ